MRYLLQIPLFFSLFLACPIPQHTPFGSYAHGGFAKRCEALLSEQLYVKVPPAGITYPTRCPAPYETLSGSQLFPGGMDFLRANNPPTTQGLAAILQQLLEELADPPSPVEASSPPHSSGSEGGAASVPVDRALRDEAYTALQLLYWPLKRQAMFATPCMCLTSPRSTPTPPS